MSTVTVELDKSVESVLEEDYGTITIRVVVLEKGSQPAVAPDEGTVDADPDEVLAEADTKRPIDSYLESPKRGRLCAVFLVNGQRQHAWDNGFIQRDLELKYLRNRMLVIVDVDGLRPEAIAHLVQGSRHQFYEGSVYDALSRRVIATLKGDPDLQRLEADAEQEISSLQAGDEVVKAALDQLIESHHEFGSRALHGHRQAGAESLDEATDGSLEQTMNLVVEAEPKVGEPAEAPSLVMRPDMSTIRLKPNEGHRIAFRAKPDDQWANVERFALTLTPPVKELEVRHETQIDCATVDLKFTPGNDFDEDEYPIQTTLRVLASFKGYDEPRVCERRIVINKSRVIGPPPPPPVLLDEPIFLRVTSRQPVRMAIGGPDVHVKLRWDGKDELAIGDPPRWRFEANCGEVDCLPSFTRPNQGRFELLLRVPDGLTTGDTFECQVEAIGPGGRTLTASFVVEVIEGTGPRRINDKIVGGSQRKPPYKLVYVHRKDWDLECWGSRTWTEEDPGCFQPPTQSEPLTLMINQDFGLLAAYRESLISGRAKLAESTIQERITRYTSHVAFHLWQMHEEMKRRQEAAATDPSIRSPDDDDMSSEIQRVAATLIKLMQVSR